MGFLLVVLFLVFIVNMISHANRVVEEQKKLLKNKVNDVKDSKADYVVEEDRKDYIVEDVVKFCPPHKWRYQEVRNSAGETIRHRIICDLCGPLKPSNGPAKVS